MAAEPSPAPDAASTRASANQVVAVEFGAQNFLTGDEIVIDEVRGDRPELKEGGTYRVRGRYTLGSRPEALLALFVTNGDSSGAQKTAVVAAGSGSFDLRFTLERSGGPHVSFYPTGGGSSFGGIYFGRGSTLYRGGGSIVDAVGPMKPKPPSSAPTSSLPAEAQARLAQAEQAMGARNFKAAREIAGPLFEAYPSVYTVQDFRCQLAILQMLAREDQAVECAAFNRLSGPPGAGEAAQGAPQTPSNPEAGLARPQQDVAGPAQTAASDHRVLRHAGRPEESSASEPAEDGGDQAQAAPGQPAPNPRELVARYFTGLRWSIAPGAVFGNGKAGISLGGQLEYGVDTGSVIVMPGVSLAGYFLEPNVYVGMPTVRIVLPLGPFAPFIEGGVGLGAVTQPSQISLAVLGGAGFVLHPTPDFILGLELGYETIVQTDFRVIIFGPIFAFSF